MSRRTFAPLALFTLTWIAACGGDSGTTPEPELGGLEPLVVGDSVDALADPLPGIQDVGRNFRAAFQDLRDSGVQFREYDGPASAGDPVPVTFPPEFLGQVFSYSTVEEGWVMDPTRTGAPADGVRILWYELDGGGNVLLPVQELGHIDVTDGTDPGLEQVQVHGVLVRTGDPNVDLMDFVQGYTTAGGLDRLEAEGTYADDSRTVDFTVDTEQGGASAQDYVLTTVLENGTTRYELRVEGVGSAPGTGLNDTFRATVDLGTDRTVLEIEITGLGPSRQATGSISFNGVVLATLAADNLLYTFSDPDGDPLSATATSELNTMVRTLLSAGLEPVSVLPLLFP